MSSLGPSFSHSLHFLLPAVSADLNDFPTDSRSPQTAYEGAGTFLACRPPPHYPGIRPLQHVRLTLKEPLISFLPSSFVLSLVRQRISQLPQEKRRPLVCFPGDGKPVPGKHWAERHRRLFLLHDHQHGDQQQKHLQQTHPADCRPRGYQHLPDADPSSDDVA